MSVKRGFRWRFFAAVLLAHCGGTVHQQTPAELGPACDQAKPEGCPVRNDCQVCVYAGGGQCGHGCKSAADCGGGLSCRKTKAYSYKGNCTKWTEEVGYCAPEHDSFGSLCAVVGDCEKTASGCAICGQTTTDPAYRCLKGCSSDTECAPKKCVTPAVTSAYTSLAACAKPERWCE